MNRSKIGLGKTTTGRTMSLHPVPMGLPGRRSYAGYGEKHFALAEKSENQVGSLAHLRLSGDKGRGKLACPEGYRYPGEGTRPQLSFIPSQAKSECRGFRAGYRPRQFRHYLWEGDDKPALGLAITQAIAGAG